MHILLNVQFHCSSSIFLFSSVLLFRTIGHYKAKTKKEREIKIADRKGSTDKDMIVEITQI